MNVFEIKLHEKPTVEKGFVLPIVQDKVDISQGYNGPWSHKFHVRGNIYVDDRYSLDFKLPQGSVVLAAKAGVVYDIIDGVDDYYAGLDIKKGITYIPNLVILDHQDETYSMYAHLGTDMIDVRPGMDVLQGGFLGRTGLSGWIGDVPHLHFSAFRMSTGFGLRKTFPVNFDNYKGPMEHSDVVRNRAKDELSDLVMVEERI